MPLRPSTGWILSGWVLLVGTYAVVSLVADSGPGLIAFGNVMQCIAPLYANAGLLVNAASPYRRRNAFWVLFALGCSLWMIAQMLWTYFEVHLRMPVPNPFIGDVIFFLHTVPMIAALALRPHARKVRSSLRYGYFDLALLALWWVYLYVFIVIPWQYIAPDESLYVYHYIGLYTVENLVLVMGLGAFFLKTQGAWRTVYAHLMGAAVLFTLGAQFLNWTIGEGTYYTGSPRDIPLVASFVWFGTAGILAQRLSPVPDPVRPEETRGDGAWAARLAMIGILSMPLFAAWGIYMSRAPQPVREFRLLVTLATIAAGSALVFLRQHMLDQDRLRLLRTAQESFENLQRLRMQFVQSEKLAALGQLAAGAAHEINNPLTAILGYSEVLLDDASLGAKPRTIVERIQEQVRRTTKLVTNLLSFARQVPAEKALLDVNAVLLGAVQLLTVDLRTKNVRVETKLESVLPAVRADANQLLQVFYNLITNAVDAMEETGGGALSVHTRREKERVVIEFADTGPGLKNPSLVFDPFYTTKPVGKGTGLGLSICYGIVQEHGGEITGFNRPEGGATFRIVLPAVLAGFPQRPAPASPSPAAKV